MACEKCGQRVPVRFVELHQNIGLIVVHFHSVERGHYCKSCIHSTFWTMQAINLTCGWWGLISLCLTPLFVISNTINYIPALFMKGRKRTPRLSPTKSIEIGQIDVIAESPETDPRERRRWR